MNTKAKNANASVLGKLSAAKRKDKSEIITKMNDTRAIKYPKKVKIPGKRGRPRKIVEES